MNIYDLISRAQKLRKETQLDSVSPDRVGGLHEDTLKYINEFQLLASSPSLHKIYASVSAMQSDKSPKSDLTGKPLKPGQLVVIVPANQTDATAGDVYRYDGPSGNTSAWTFVAKIGTVPADAELSATSTNPPQNKVVTEKLTELESKSEEEKLQRFSLIGNGAVQQYLIMVSGKIESAQTILFVYHSDIKVSESYTNAPAVYCRIYDSSGKRVLNQQLTYNKTQITIPDGGATFSLDLFASVVGNSVVGAEYSVDIRYWYSNNVLGLYEEREQKINESIQNIESNAQLADDYIGLLNKQKVTPTTIADNYIRIDGRIIGASSYNVLVYTNPIELNKGDVIILRASTINEFVAAISLTDVNGSKYTSLVRGLAGNKRGIFSYVATENCYVALSYQNVDAEVFVSNGGIIPQIEIEQSFIRNSLDVVGLLDSAILTPSVTENKYVYFPNGAVVSSGSNPMRMTQPIEMKSGDIIKMYASTLNNVVSPISISDGNGNIIKALYAGSYDYKNYRFLAIEDCYVVLCYYGDDVKIEILRNTSFNQIGGQNELAGLNFGVDGDSITVGNQWSYIVYQNLNFATHHNVALGSATFGDKYLTLNGKVFTPQDYNSADYVGMSNGWQSTTDETELQKRANNCARVHIQKFIAEVDAGTYPKPDIFVFAMGTNDSTIGTLEDALSGKDIESLSDEVRRTMLGGARYAIQKIIQTYPQCRVFLSVPIQRADSAANKTTYEKVVALRQLCDAMSVKCFNTYGECGICEKVETGTGPYLSDGLHPNDEGRKLMGEYLTKEIRNNMW